MNERIFARAEQAGCVPGRMLQSGEPTGNFMCSIDDLEKFVALIRYDWILDCKREFNKLDPKHFTSNGILHRVNKILKEHIGVEE
jgi:hypothetical protein